MDPKLLTETAWKAIAAKFKVKDNGLQRALAAYGKLDEKACDDRFKTISSVAQLATSLQKSREVAAISEVVEYLDSVRDATDAEKGEITKLKVTVAKTEALNLKKAEADAQKREKDGEDEEEEGDSLAKLTSALKTLKLSKKPYFFLVCDVKPYGLVVSRKDIRKSTQARKDLAQIAGGTTRPPKVGECRCEGGKYVFEMEKPPSGLARILQKWIKDSTGLGLRVMVGTESAEDEEGKPGKGDPKEAAQAASSSAAPEANPAGAKAMAVPQVSVAPGAERDQLVAFAASVDQIKPIDNASFPDGKQHFYYTDVSGKTTELLEDHVKKIRESTQRKLNIGFDSALGIAKDATDIYQSQKKSWGDRAIGWTIESVGLITDPGDKIKQLVAATNRAASEGRSAGKFEVAAQKLIEAASAADSASHLILAYKKKMIGTGEVVVVGLKVVKKTCEITLEVAAIVASGGAAAAAVAGKAAIGVTEAGIAPLIYDEEIEWGKLAAVGLDVVFSKFGVAEKAEKFILQQAMKTALGKALGEKIVTKYVAKFVAEKALDLFKKFIEQIGKKPKKMNWKTFVEKILIVKLTQIFIQSFLPNSIPPSVKEAIAKKTAEPVGEAVVQ